MPTSTLASPAVAEFASAVRAALSDLAPEEIDELTDGLEADLTDRLSDTDASELGDPRAYAEELRAAAGLPHRPAARASFASELAELRHAPKIIAAAFREFGAAHPWVGRVGDFLVALRPAWWVFRAAVVTALIINVTSPGWSTPINGLNILIGLVVLVVSVQLGRGKWLRFAWMRGMLLVANVILVLCTPFIAQGVTVAVNDGWYREAHADETSQNLSNTGLLESGNPVSNIFAYDAQGNPLRNVQLYDQDGKPLDLMSDTAVPYGAGGASAYTVPNDAVTGRPGWNVFPLDHVKQNGIADDGTVKPNAHRIPAELPFATAKPLAGLESATPAPTPTPTP